MAVPLWVSISHFGNETFTNLISVSAGFATKLNSATVTDVNNGQGLDLIIANEESGYIVIISIFDCTPFRSQQISSTKWSSPRTIYCLSF